MATPTNLPTAFVAGDILTAANMNLIRGGFRVLQIVGAQTSTQVTHNSTTYSSTFITATITPQFNTSKIMVMVTVNGTVKGAENSGNALNFQLLRGATEIYTVKDLHYTGTALQITGSCAFNFLDSPATTAATTYLINAKNSVATFTVATQYQSQPSTIYLAEISA